MFYSWFVAGVVGLSLSLYGLAGAEAGMLMEKRWEVKDAMRLMLHADRTWSGPGGWMKALKWSIPMSRRQSKRLPSLLWFVLAFPSLVVFIAWPLSGLCLEMTSGYLNGSSGQGANVTGFNRTSFNANPDGRRPSRESYVEHGHGAVYMPAGYNQSQSTFQQKRPVVLPNTERVKEVFLAAQAETPIEGQAWGLLLTYDCKVVERLSEFTLLRNRRSSADVWRGQNGGNISTLIDVDHVECPRAVTDAPPDPTSTDEFGFPLGPTDSIIPPSRASDIISTIPTATGCSPLAFDYNNLVKYKSYRLNDNNILVEVGKAPRGAMTGWWSADTNKWSVNLDAVIETAYTTLPPDAVSEQETPCGLLNGTLENPQTSYCYHDMY